MSTPMITLELNNFRCWQDLTLKLPVSGIVLLRGPSGSGKSTIFESLAWLIGAKIQKVYPLSLGKSSKTKVSLTLPNLKIVRTRNSNTLTISYQNKDYRGTEAEKLLQQLLISPDYFWLAYVAQGTKSGFLNLSKQDQLDFLNRLAFVDQDPQKMLSKIKDEIQSKNSVIKDISAKVNAQQWAIKNRFKDAKNYLESKEFLESLEFKDYTSIILETKKELQQVISECEEYRIKTEMSRKLQNDYNNICSQIPQEPSIPKNLLITEDQLPFIGKEIELRNQLVERQKLTNKLQLLPLVTESFETLTSKYTSCLQAEKELQCFYEKCRKIQVTKITELDSLYEEISVQQKLYKLQELQTLEKSLKDKIIQQSSVSEPLRPYYDKESWQKLNDEINNLDVTIAEYQSKKIAYNQELSVALQRCQLLQCPNCKSGLKLDGKHLQLHDLQPIDHNVVVNLQQSLKDIDTNITKINRNISSLKSQQEALMHNFSKAQQKYSKDHEQWQQQQQNINNLQKNLDNVTVDINNLDIPNIIFTKPYIKSLNDKQLQNLQKTVELLIFEKSKILNLESQHLDPSSIWQDKLNIYQERLNLEKKLQNMSSTVLQYDHVSVQDYNIAKKYYTDFHSYFQKLQIFESKKQDLFNRLSQSLSNIVKDRSLEKPELEAKITKFTKLQQDINLYEEYQEYCKVLESLNNNLAENLNDLGILEEFKKIVLEAEHETTINVVDILNEEIDHFCSNLFDKPLTATIQLEKQLESGGDSRQEVNFQIDYNGNLYQKINMLSGGEQDRLSLALTLSLFKLSRIPFLLLDENLSSLDSEIKEKAVKCISTNNNRLVLVTLHDTVEGIYDYCIDVDKIGTKY